MKELMVTLGITSVLYCISTTSVKDSFEGLRISRRLEVVERPPESNEQHSSDCDAMEGGGEIEGGGEGRARGRWNECKDKHVGVVLCCSSPARGARQESKAA
ncbi:hypothetical protein Sjap_001352 [Stephania japonica]|uniref:Uncharacterized protein n=1 Tax=Stephania japonica TaxID=461633 RepID=A0AAP0KM34_9MAGN